MKMTPAEIPDVIHVSSVHPWTDNRIHYRECVSLAEAGYRVALVAVESAVDGPRGDVAIVTIPRRSRLRRMIVSSMQVIGIAIASRAKIVHLHDPELLPHVVILRLLGRGVIYDAHEDLPTQILSKPYLNKPARAALGVFARGLIRLVRFTNLAVAATETIAEHLPTSKTVLVHNYPPLRTAEADALSGEVTERRMSAVYVGGISPRRGATVMVDALALEAARGWRLSLAGSMPQGLLDRLMSRGGWNGVDFAGQLPPDDARQLILESRVGFVLFEDNAAHRDALPTKMFEYFAAGVPVIASDFPLWRSIVEAYECGILVDPDDAEAVAEALRTYAESPSLLASHSRNARRLAVEKLNWKPEGARLIEAYRELSEG